MFIPEMMMTLVRSSVEMSQFDVEEKFAFLLKKLNLPMPCPWLDEPDEQLQPTGKDNVQRKERMEIHGAVGP